MKCFRRQNTLSLSQRQYVRTDDRDGQSTIHPNEIVMTNIAEKGSTVSFFKEFILPQPSWRLPGRERNPIYPLLAR